MKRVGLAHAAPGAALLLAAALAACSGGGSSTHALIPGNGIGASSKTRASFVVHWPSAPKAAAIHRNAISPSTASITVAVNGGAPSVVNRPTLTGSPSSTTISIVAPVGNDSFTFTAWDQPGGTGNALDVATASQDIIANQNNAVSVTLDGVCSALTASVTGTSTYVQATNESVPLASGATQTVLQKLRLVGPYPATVTINQIDADGNTVLNSSGAIPVALTESGSTQHVTIAPVSNVAGNTQFTLTPLIAEADGMSTSLTATSPNCGAGTATFPNSFALSTSAEIIVADKSAGILAFDQDGNPLATIATTTGITGLAYNPSNASLVAIESIPTTGGFNFQTLTTNGTPLGSGSQTFGTLKYPVGNIAYNPANGYYLVAAREYTSGSTTKYGTVKEYTISGSTATPVTPTAPHPFQQSASTPPPYDPNCFAILQNGNVIVGDTMTNSYLYDQNGNELNNAAVSSAESFALDTLRQTIIDFSGSSYGYVYNSSLTAIGNLYYAGLESAPTIPASVYLPGVDEIIGFGSTGGVFGVPGSVETSNNSNVPSELPIGAFLSVTAPSQAIALP